MPECGTCHPPPDDSADREAIDRFKDFLAAAPPPLASGDIRSHWLEGLSPAHRWRCRYLLWKCNQPIGDPA